MYNTKDVNYTADNMIRMISAVVDSKLEHLNYDRTIVGEIKSQDAKNKKYYIVIYEGANYNAESDLENLQVGDSVYMLLPGGELANRRKKIIGKAVIEDAVDLKKKDDGISYLTPEYAATVDGGGFIAKIEEISEQSSAAISFPSTIEDFITHCQYNLDGFEINAIFKNAFIFPQKKSSTFSYGLRLDFFCGDNEQIKTITFDSNDMIGTVYNLTQPIEQKQVFFFEDYGIDPSIVQRIEASIYINGRVAETGSLMLESLKLTGIRADSIENTYLTLDYAIGKIQASIYDKDGNNVTADYTIELYGEYCPSIKEQFVLLATIDKPNNTAEFIIDENKFIGRKSLLKCVAKKGTEKLESSFYYIKSNEWLELVLNQQSAKVTPKLFLMNYDQMLSQETLDNYKIGWYYRGYPVINSESDGSVNLSNLNIDLGEQQSQETYNKSYPLYCVAYIDGYKWATAVTRYTEELSSVWRVEYAVGGFKSPIEDPDAWKDIQWHEKSNIEVAAGQYKWKREILSNGDIRYEIMPSDGKDGVSPIIVEIDSSAGDIYINNNINTILSARVMENNIEITEEFPDDAFSWQAFDISGNSIGVPRPFRTLTITSNDVKKKATFVCSVDMTKRNKNNE